MYYIIFCPKSSCHFLKCLLTGMLQIICVYIIPVFLIPVFDLFPEKQNLCLKGWFLYHWQSFGKSQYIIFRGKQCHHRLEVFYAILDVNFFFSSDIRRITNDNIKNLRWMTIQIILLNKLNFSLV